MADFTKTAISQNAKREFTAPVASLEAFNAVVEAFRNDTSMGFTNKKQTAENLKAQIVYFDENSNEKGSVVLYAEDREQFETMVAFLEGDLAAEAANGENHGGASRDSTLDSWIVKFSCTNMVTVGGTEVEDNFTVTFGRTYMNVTSFSYEETINKIETWADAQDALA